MTHITLDPVEARVLGVLLEKEVTTPDVYPLSINATLTACNQKSSRDPVMALREDEVRDALERLVGKTLVREQGSAGGRTRRFSHRMDARLFGTLEFSREERAVLCVLLLRGPQTPGEIRGRTGRLAAFPDVGAVEAMLDALARRGDGPHVAAMAREPGRREVRWRHLFGAQADAPPAETGIAPGAQADTPSAGTGIATPAPGLMADTRAGDAVQRLGERLAEVEARLEALEEILARHREAQDATAPDHD
jgi:uncharacterized protein YceH (UPF0502 family)